MREAETTKLYDSITEIDSRYVQEAQQTPAPAPQKHAGWMRWVAIAACLCLVIVLVPMLGQKWFAPQEQVDEALPPHFAVDDRTFYLSVHASAETTLPDGFTKAGEIEVPGVGTNHYFGNPSVPEYVYVYQPWPNEDQTETAQNYYIRYVDGRIKDKQLICYGDTLYISLWNVEHSGAEPDVTESSYQHAKSLYGVRLEGAAPEGFTQAGTTEFIGYDRVPAGALASNSEATAIYENPDQPEILLAQTEWCTAANGENGETQHTGFDVYVRYTGAFAQQ